MQSYQLSWLKLQSYICRHDFWQETLRDGSRQSESSATGRLGPASVVLLEGQPPNHQMVVTMAVGTSQALGSSRGWGPTARHAALMSVGAVHIDIPQHPVVLHSMVTRSSKQLSTTLQELRRSAPGRTAQRPPMEERTLVRTLDCVNIEYADTFISKGV